MGGQVDIAKGEDYHIIILKEAYVREGNKQRKEIQLHMWTTMYMIRPVTRCKEGCPS